MLSTKVGVLALLLFGACRADNSTTGNKLFCYYDGSFSVREELSRVNLTDIEPALPLCTHLIYGYAGVNATTHRLSPLNADLDLDAGQGLYRAVTTLKTRYPNLKVFLSVGAYHDLESTKPHEKYLSLLESESSRKAFATSAYAVLKTYNFDGLDLAWQFPQTKPIRIRGWSGELWHGFKKLFTGNSVLDPKADEHREQFTALVRDLKNTFEQDKFQLMYTQLPHVNQTIFLDIPLLKDNLNYVNLAAYDQQTPDRNPKAADYYAPIYGPSERVAGNNVDDKVKAWESKGTPLNKIVLGIASYGRGWKLVGESAATGIPPIQTDGPSPPGPYTETPGFYSFSEVCFRIRKLPVPSKDYKGERPLTRVEDPTKRFGTYAFRIPSDTNAGVWLSYESLESVSNKAAYAKEKGLAGMSINDLAMDDHRGTYYVEKFPIVRIISGKESSLKRWR